MIDEEEFIEWLFDRSGLTEGEIVEACGVDISDLAHEHIDELQFLYWDEFIQQEYPGLAESDNGKG